jgi:hypothetical protein
LKRQSLDDYEGSIPDDDFFPDDGDGSIADSPAQRYAPFEDPDLTALAGAILDDLETQPSRDLRIDVSAMADAAGVESSEILRAVRYLAKTGAITNLRRSAGVYLASRPRA